jgi:hypothetical protein
MARTSDALPAARLREWMDHSLAWGRITVVTLVDRTAQPISN